jgi:hypothetical protein
MGFSVERYDQATGQHRGYFPLGYVGTEALSGGAFDADGSFYFLGNGVGYGAVFRSSGRFGENAATFIDYNTSTGITLPMKLRFNADGRLLVLGREYSSNSWGPGKIWIYDGTTGLFQKTLSSPLLNSPSDLAVMPDGTVLVTDSAKGLFSGHPNRTGLQQVFQTGSRILTNATGIAFGPDGNVYVSSYNTDEVFRFDGRSYTNNVFPPPTQPTFPFIDVVIPSGLGGLKSPGLLVFGPDGLLYVHSTGTDSILRYNPTTGAFIDVFTVLAPEVASRGVSGLTFTPPAPSIKTSRLPAALVLEWPRAWTNYVAEQSFDPSKTNGWTALEVAPSVVGTNLVLTNSTSADSLFFRLRRID